MLYSILHLTFAPSLLDEKPSFEVSHKSSVNPRRCILSLGPFYLLNLLPAFKPNPMEKNCSNQYTNKGAREECTKTERKKHVNKLRNIVD